MQATKVIILPGNGCVPIKKCLWYKWVQDQLEKKGIRCVLKDMPDPFVARESIWIPFLKEELQCDENTVLVGHSSGAQCAMRYMENNKLAGCVLVSPCITDQGDDNERESGYYDRPWLWGNMRKNCPWIAQFSSPQDHLIPFEEMLQVKDNLKPDEFFALKDYGHFQDDFFPELVNLIVKYLKQQE